MSQHSGCHFPGSHKNNHNENTNSETANRSEQTNKHARQPTAYCNKTVRNREDVICVRNFLLRRYFFTESYELNLHVVSCDVHVQYPFTVLFHSCLRCLLAQRKINIFLFGMARYDIWCRDLDTDQTSTEQTCGRTDQNVSHTKIEIPTSGSGRGQKS